MPSELIDALKLGVIGLSGIALIYSVQIIYREQQRPGEPRKEILNFAMVFLGFCLALVTINAFVEVRERQLPPNDQADLYLNYDSLMRLSPEQLADSQNPTAAGRVWSQFYRYRATIRALLRQMCQKESIEIKDAQAITSMVEALQSKKVLEAELANDIKEIARATFTAQWGAGDPPTPDQARFVAEKAPQVIQELQARLRTLKTP